MSTIIWSVARALHGQRMSSRCSSPIHWRSRLLDHAPVVASVSQWLGALSCSTIHRVLAGRTTHSQNAIVAFSLHYTPRRIIWPILSDLIYRPRGSRRIDVYYVTNYNIMHSCNGKFMHHESEWQWPSNVTTGLIYQMQPMKLFSTSRQQNITIYKLNTH